MKVTTAHIPLYERVSVAQLSETVESLSGGTASEALQIYRTELRKAERLKQMDKAGWALLRIAMVLRGQHKFDVAIQYLKEARHKMEEVQDQLGHASVFLELSLCHRECQRNALALEYGHKAKELFEHRNHPRELSWALNNLATIHVNLYKSNESLVYAKKARELFEKQRSKGGQAWNACILVTIYYDLGRFLEAKKYCREAHSIFTALKNEQGIAWATLWLGMVNRELCEFKLALEFLKRSEKLFTNLKLKDRIGWCVLNEAAIMRHRGDVKRALALNKKGCQLFSPIKNNDGVAWGLFQMAQLYRDQGQSVKAWGLIRKVLGIQTDIGNWKGIAWAENESGQIYLNLDDLPQAESSFSKAQEIMRRTEGGILLVELEKNLGLLNLLKGNFEEAEKNFEKGAAIAPEKILSEGFLKIWLGQASLYMVLGKLDKVEQCLKRIQPMISQQHFERFSPIFQILSGELLVGLGEPDKATKRFLDAYTKAKRLGQHMSKVKALYGLIQLQVFTRGLENVNQFMKEFEKEVRNSNSRKIKAKFLFLKGIMLHKTGKNGYEKAFDQALRICEAADLKTLEIQIVTGLLDFYKQGRTEAELKAFVNRFKVLTGGIPKAYVEMIKGRTSNFQNMPVFPSI